MDSVLQRLLVAAVIALLGAIVYWLWGRLRLRRLRKAQRGLEDTNLGTPVILYFTTPTCVPCKTQQRPALKQLVEDYGVQVQIVQVDATEKPDLADYWGVLSVPTTFIIDSQGEPRAMNPGVASADKLLRQLTQAEGDKLSRKLAGKAITPATIEKSTRS
jgi:thioredoxin 1